MSKNIFQVFTANPITVNSGTDLMYFGQSPYGIGDDAGMTFSDFKAQFGTPFTPAALTKTDDTNVTLTLGGTPSTALLEATSITAGWTGQLAVGRGGTGNSTFTAFSVLCAGTTATGAFQNVSGLGTSGQVLTSQGAGSLPQWAAPATSGTVTSISAGTGITLTPSPITTTGSVALTVPVTEILGGTNQTTYTLGDMIYSSAANTLSKLAGNITSVKQYLSQTGTGAVSAAPAWDTISGTDITGAALTKTDDTNVTMTLGGTPSTALLRAASLTLGWTGQLALTRGGTNASLVASNGGIFYSTATAGAILSGTATAGQHLQSGASAAPSWTTATYPSTGGAAGNVFISDGTNYVASTSLWPNTVGTSGKVVISNGTSNVYSTPTFPNASATSGKIIISDGTNWIASTPTYPAAAGTSGNVLTSDGTNWLSSAAAGVTLLTTKGDLFGFSTVNARVPVATGDGKVLQVSSGATVGLAYSTPTYPSASGSAGQILRSDGTNNLYTTSTYPNTNAINTLLYASAANVMSALATANSSVLVTDSGGIPSLSTTLPSFTTNTITFSPTTAGIKGTTTNDNTAAGNVGEYISSSILTASAVSITTDTPKNITSISLTAGDWDVRGMIVTKAAAGTTTTYVWGSISTTTATLATLGAENNSILVNGALGASNNDALPVGPMRMSLSGTTTVYLVIQVGFAVSTNAAYGFIGARRIR